MTPIAMRMRAYLQGDDVVVRALMFHDEDTGLVTSPYGDVLPAHFIQTVSCSHNGRLVMRCDWGIAISKNPYIEFSFKGGKRGDPVSVSWLDNLGQTQSGSTTVE